MLRVRRHVFFFVPRFGCVNYSEGHKSSVHTHHNYLIIVSPPFVPTASAASATVRNFVARTPNPTDTDISKVVVFEPENKYVAYSGTFKHDIREIISQWGQIYVLTGDGNVRQYPPSLYGTQPFIPLVLAIMSTREVDVGKARHVVPQIPLWAGIEPGEDPAAR